MGCFDTVLVPCPKCGNKYQAQSKSGEQLFMSYELDEAPDDVIYDVNRYAPFRCKCGALFHVTFKKRRAITDIAVREIKPEEYDKKDS